MTSVNVLIYELPKSCSGEHWVRLRAAIVGFVAKELDVLASTVQVTLSPDVQLARIEHTKMIYCQIGTRVFDRDFVSAFFAAIGRALGWKDPLQEKRKKLTQAVAEAISRSVGKHYGVRTYLGSLGSFGETHIKPQP